MKIDAEARQRLEEFRAYLSEVIEEPTSMHPSTEVELIRATFDDILLEVDTATTPSQIEQADGVPDVDELAQFIRRINGANEMGAGLLAEAIVGWLETAKQETDHD